jgi:hypothetical protein
MAGKLTARPLLPAALGTFVGFRRATVFPAYAATNSAASGKGSNWPTRTANASPPRLHPAPDNPEGG